MRTESVDLSSLDTPEKSRELTMEPWQILSYYPSWVCGRSRVWTLDESRGHREGSVRTAAYVEDAVRKGVLNGHKARGAGFEKTASISKDVALGMLSCIRSLTRSMGGWTNCCAVLRT